MENTVKLFCDGLEYTDFKEVSITKSLNHVAGSFEAVVANNNLSNFPIKQWQDIKVEVNNEQVMAGYISVVNPSYDQDSEHDINIAGYDYTVDIVDSHIIANTQYQGPLTFGDFCRKVIADNNLVVGVFDLSGVEFSEEEEMSAETGQTVFEFLRTYAYKKGLILNSDNRGVLVSYRNNGEDSKIEIINQRDKKNNRFIKSATPTFDMTNRYSKVVVKSQGGLNGFPSFCSLFGEDLENIQGFAIDEDVKRNRTLLIVSKSASDSKACEEQAIWEINKRRADSIKYKCEVFGFTAPNGQLWSVGDLITISDDYAGIQSTMLLDETTFIQSENSGSTTRLSFVSPSTYKLVATEPQKNINNIANDLLL